MSPPSLLSLMLIFSILCHIHSTLSTNHLIQQTCKNCSETDPNISYRFCITSFQSDSKTLYVQNLTELGLISIKLIRHNVSDTITYTKKLLNKKKLDPFIKECLDDCLHVYSDALTTLREAIRDYKGKRYDDSNVKLSSVIDTSTTCEDGFNQNNGVISPLTKRNKDNFQLSAIALSIINMLNVDKLKGVF
ncbi:PREDICTED: putative invertase inhibitor [Lupinus angustifolius]|uniref:putative invertase inhibitor n=1 Tax=Lupinus angustifolius TaxID=3871 RepID=UPI00092F90E1|nr:PREDICTED: putative invertase inhibitor [Lupinus angustifolius]